MRPLPVGIGDEFGRLTVKAPADRDAKGQIRWRCRCECGTFVVVASSRLHKGSVASCGCLRRETTARTGRASATRHGEASNGRVSAEYNSWRSMVARCSDPKNIGYAYYGGRGITVCERWRDSYPAFLDDMGRRPTSRHSIDRIDVNGNYEPGNCRWATPREQSSNRRNNRNITIEGVTKTLAQWSRDTGIYYYTIDRRIRFGWPESEWLLPAERRRKRVQ